ncbi:MAG TPA: winged helix-turn-helix transcriptional regulator [Candidatus Thermoplasmatota archaeon]|nr:winged helix-turn-helix transcriptional regulator [Candidatus Thermoplasmatota archaeon]
MKPNAWDTPPDRALPRGLAHTLYAARSQLTVAVLDALASHPRRYGELRPLLKGRNNNLLSRALHDLQEEGLLAQRDWADPDAETAAYELTSLGVAVRDVIVELRAADRFVASARGTSGHPAPA